MKAVRIQLGNGNAIVKLVFIGIKFVKILMNVLGITLVMLMQLVQIHKVLTSVHVILDSVEMVLTAKISTNVTMQPLLVIQMQLVTIQKDLTSVLVITDTMEMEQIAQIVTNATSMVRDAI